MKKILFLLMFLISVAASAQKWYVATTGSDTHGKGTLADPWLTVKHATDTITDANGFAGDTIVVGTGIFSEPVQPALSVGISLIGQQVSPLTSIITSANGIDIINASSASGDAVDGNQSISYLKFNGNDTIALRAIVSNYRGNVSIHHCTFENFKYNGVLMHGTTSAWNITPTNILPVNNKVYNCVFTNCTQKTGNSETGHIVANGQKGFQIYNNTFDQTDRGAGNNADIIGAYQHYGMKIHDNTFTKADDNGAGEFNFFCEMHYGHGGFELYNNTFNGAATWDYSGNEQGSYDYAGKIYNNQWLVAATPNSVYNQPALTMESFDKLNDTYVYNNYFKNVRTAISLLNITTEANNVWIYYNIIDGFGCTDNLYNYGIQIGSYYASSSATPFSNIHIYNNTIKGDAYGSRAGILTSAWGDITNMYVDNNIITGCTYRGIRFIVNNGTPVITNLDVISNISYDNTTDAVEYAAGITFVNDTESGTLYSDPLFVGGSPYSYKLQSTSPARDAGIDVGLSYDYDGATIKGLPDIGAYEYESFPLPSGIGWDKKLYKERVRDSLNIEGGWMIKNEPIVTSARTLNKLDGLVGTAPQINHVTDHFVAGDTTVTAIVGRIVYQSADSSFYGCRSTVAPKKWYKLHD